MPKATGTMGAPDRRAKVTMPSPARHARTMGAVGSQTDGLTAF